MGLSESASNIIFNRIASRYDLVNAVLSFGFHRAWRLRLVCALPDQISNVLDLACGTGSIPLAFIERRKAPLKITGVDISENMILVARKQLKRISGQDKVQLVRGNALCLPFQAGSFDAVTIGFALRNVADIMRLVSSAYRVLQPGGLFGILEFSKPEGMAVRFLHRVYLEIIIPLVGVILTGDLSAYRHLGQSIIQFPDNKRFFRMLRQSGFRNITVQPLAFGAVTLYMAQK